MEMIIIPAEFAQLNNGKQDNDSPNIFNSVELKNGDWICDPNSLIDFPLLFEGTDFPIREVLQSEIKLVELPNR